MHIKALDTIKSKSMKGLGIGDIGPVALSIGFAVIVVAVIALILAQIRGGSTNTNFTYTIDKGLVAITSFADWFGIIIIVVVAVIILALVMMLGGGTRQGKRG